MRRFRNWNDPPLITTSEIFRARIEEEAADHLSRSPGFHLSDRYLRVPFEDELRELHRRGARARKLPVMEPILHLPDDSLVKRPETILERYPDGSVDVKVIDPDCNQFAKHLASDVDWVHLQKHRYAPEYAVAQVRAADPAHVFNIAIVRYGNKLELRWVDAFTSDRSLRIWPVSEGKPTGCYVFWI